MTVSVAIREHRVSRGGAERGGCVAVKGLPSSALPLAALPAGLSIDGLPFQKHLRARRSSLSGVLGSIPSPTLPASSLCNTFQEALPCLTYS